MDATIDPYRWLAAAIVARCTEDLVLTLIFQRDIERYDQLVYKRADRAFAAYTTFLKNKRNTKKLHRAEKKRFYTLMAIQKADLEHHKENLELLLESKVVTEVELERLRRVRKSRVMPTRNYLREINMQIERETRAVFDLQVKLEKVTARYEAECEYLRKIKSQELTLRRYISIKGQRKHMLDLARQEQKRIEQWFHSEQFEILSELDPNGVIDTAKRAVRNGLTVNKETKHATFFLTTTTAKGDGIHDL